MIIAEPWFCSSYLIFESLWGSLTTTKLTPKFDLFKY